MAQVSPPEDCTAEQNEQQKISEFQLYKENLELKQLLQKAGEEKKDTDKHVKEKEGNIKDLEMKLQERDREIKQLQTSYQEQLKITEEQADKIESLQDDVDATRLQSQLLKEKIVSLVNDLSVAEVKISQYEEMNKRGALPTESVSLPAVLNVPAATAAGQSEEEEINTVNTYSRECGKLKKQLATANEEIDSLRKQMNLFKDEFQARSHGDAHMSALTTELNNERSKTATLERKLDEMSERSARANSTLRGKLNISEIQLKKLQEILEPRNNQSAPATMTQEPQDNSPAVYVPNETPVVNKQLSDERETLPEVKLDLLPARERSSTLKALEEESEMKRREADRALQEIEETRRELLNQNVNFSDTSTNDSGYPQSPVQSSEQLIDVENGTVMNEQELVAERRMVVTDSPSANTNSELTAGLIQTPATDDTDTDSEPWPENKLIEGIDQEIQYYADQVRQMSRRPDTAEVELSDEDDSLPYDPNLVCPKCGKRYRIGGVQKFRRHVKELCTASS